jgi:hypothetical protein
LSENAESDLGPAASSRVRVFFERQILPCRPAFTDPAADSFAAPIRLGHLVGCDQPFETQLQTAWVNFGEQTWGTFP